MPRIIPDNIKSLVIEKWLSGDSRDKIALDLGIGAGTVTNIIDHWERALGSNDAYEIRDLAITLKNMGLTYLQCARGARVATTMRRIGIREDEFESFMISLYNHCYNELGLTPERIGDLIKNLLEFSDIVPFSQIPDYILQKKEEKNRLEEQIKEQETKIRQLETRETELERIVASTSENLKWHIGIKEELETKYKIQVNDIPKFAKTIDGISQMGFDVNKIVIEYSEIESARTDYISCQERIPSLKMQINQLDRQCSDLKEWVNSYTQRLSLIENLEAMGFGFKELKSLWYAILEISDANNISREDAVKRFFKEIEEHYDDILGLQLRKQKLEAENSDLGQQNLELSAKMSILTTFRGPFARLLFDIVVTNSPEDVCLFVDMVHKVGGIKNAIEKLSDQPTLSTDIKTPILSSNGNKNDIADGQPEKNTRIKLAHISMVYQRNISSTDETKNDQAAVLPVNNYSEDDNHSNNMGEERVKQAFGQENDPSFKGLLNQVIYRSPSCHIKSNDDSKWNVKQQVDDNNNNNNFNNNAANNVEVAQTDKNILMQKETLLPVTQSNEPGKYFNFNFNSNLAFMSICCLLQLLARRMVDRESTNKERKL